MKSRLAFFALVAMVATVAMSWCGAVLAQAYPSKPLKIVVPYPAGGYYDVIARIVGPRLAESLGQPVIVENRVGANAIVGTDFTAKSPPDGYTIMVGGIGPHAINVSLYRNLPYDPVRDFAPVVHVAVQPLILVVHPASAANSVKEVIAAARSQPGKLSYASNGSGSTPHLAGEMLSSLEGIKLNHVPFKGSAPAVVAALAGHTDMLFGTASDVLQHIKAGKLRALAVTGASRIPALPDVPTMAESGIQNYEAVAWFAFFAPAAVAREIILRLNAEIGRILESPEVREKLSAAGTVQLMGGAPELLGNMVKSEIAKWSKIVSDSGARAD
jgi:tripartite-type tricarboxylate transporter receptor subunit TctC